MDIYNAQVLRELIRKSGMKHSYLAHGLCDTAHLSNVLHGKRKLSTELFREILIKLGLNPFDYLHIKNLQDIEQIEKLGHLRGLLREKPDNFVELCTELVAELEPLLPLFTTAQVQDLFNIKLSILFFQQNYSAMRDMARQALAMTRINLLSSAGVVVLENIYKLLPKMILSHREAGLFIKLAISYGADPTANTTNLTHLQVADTILEKLWVSLCQLPDETYEVVNVKIMCLVNYTKTLYLLGKREQLVIELCDVGIDLCGRYWDGEHLSGFIARKGHVLVETGKKTAGQECLRKACLLFEGADKTKELKFAKKILSESESDCD